MGTVVAPADLNLLKRADAAVPHLHTMNSVADQHATVAWHFDFSHRVTSELGRTRSCTLPSGCRLSAQTGRANRGYGLPLSAETGRSPVPCRGANFRYMKAV